MTSYITILQKLEAFSNAHLQIQKFAGEFREQMPNFSTMDERYPLVFVTPVSDVEDLNTNQFTLEIYCVDIIQKNRANLNTIVSDCHLILKDLFIYYRDDNDPDLDVIGTASISFVNNFDLDYVAGAVMTITFEVAGYGSCEIPMSPITPTPNVCEDATLNVFDFDGNLIETVNIPSGDTFNYTLPETPTCEDATYLVEYENGTPIESGSIPSGGSATIQVPNPIVCANAVVNVNGLFWANVPSGGTENVVVRQSTGSTQVGYIQGQYFRIGDSTAVLKDTNGNTISTTSIKAQASANIVAPNTTIEVNGVSEGSVVAGSTVDVQLFDSVGTVTPLSVTQSGNDFLVELPDAPPCPPAVTRSTATLMKTGQTTSYRTGDDGDIEAGRATNFLTLDAAPLHNDGSPTINTTTNRFTDTLGGQTYANNIVLDWSTWNGSTLLGYHKNANSALTWNNAIDTAAAYSVGTFTSGWRLANKKEMLNLFNYELNQVLNYSPFNHVGDHFTSTTSKASTTFAFVCGGTIGDVYRIGKTSAAVWKQVRTFSLSTSNVLS